MTKVQSLTRRGIIYCLGLFILALGVSVSIASNLGVSPVSSLPYVLSLVIGIEMGICTSIIYVIYIILQIIILRRDYQKKDLLQIFSTTIFSVFLTITNMMTAGLDNGGMYPMQLLFCAISIVLIAIGVTLYVPANVLCLPIEGLTLAISQKYGKEFPKVKMCIDISIVVASIALSYIGLAGLFGIREGTVFAAVGVGFCMKFTRKIMSDRIDKFLNNNN